MKLPRHIREDAQFRASVPQTETTRAPLDILMLDRVIQILEKYTPDSPLIDRLTEVSVQHTHDHPYTPDQFQEDLKRISIMLNNIQL